MREHYSQLLLKLGFSGTETHFPTLWNYKAHESKQISDGERGEKWFWKN